MKNQCSKSLQHLNLSGCKLSNFDLLFKNCSFPYLTSLNISRFETIKSEHLKLIGDYCQSLNYLNMSLIAVSFLNCSQCKF